MAVRSRLVGLSIRAAAVLIILSEPPGVLVLVASAKLAKFALVFKFAQPVTVAIMCTAK